MEELSKLLDPGDRTGELFKCLASDLLSETNKLVLDLLKKAKLVRKELGDLLEELAVLNNSGDVAGKEVLDVIDRFRLADSIDKVRNDFLGIAQYISNLSCLFKDTKLLFNVFNSETKG